MPSKRRTMPAQDPTPLRSGKAFRDPDEEQERALAAFLAAMVIGYNGVYCTRYAQSGAIKLKVYADGESYEDALETNEEWGPVLGDYAKRFGVLATYQSLYAARPATAPGSPAEGREGAPPSEGATPGASKPLRGS